jgi:copper chaperone CopZ
VQTIEESLSKLTPKPLSIQISAGLKSVIVHHFKALSHRAIRHAVEDAGFDVVLNPSEDQDISDSDCLPNNDVRWLAQKRQRHLGQCLFCNQEQKSPAYVIDLSQTQLDYTADHAERNNPQFSYEDKVGKLIHVPLSVPTFEESSVVDDGSFVAIFSVGGMTCSSCSNTITSVISELKGVSEITVSLLDGSATAVIERKDLADVVREAVEDCGFEAQLISIESVHTNDVINETKTRTISLRVDGMYCQ